VEMYFHFSLNSLVYRIVWPLELLYLLALPRLPECLPFISLVEKSHAIKLSTGCYLGKSLTRSEGSHWRTLLWEHSYVIYPNNIEVVPGWWHFWTLFSGLHCLDAL